MVDEKESVENDEAKVDDAPKRAGRPAKRVTAQPATEDGEKKPAAKKAEQAAPTGKIIPEGEEVKVNTRIENGAEVASETVYRQKRLPNSPDYTYILVASEGTRIQ